MTCPVRSLRRVVPGALRIVHVHTLDRAADLGLEDRPRLQVDLQRKCRVAVEGLAGVAGHVSLKGEGIDSTLATC